MDALGGDFLDAVTRFAFPLIATLALASARAAGMIAITPAFSRLGLSGMIRTAVGVAIAIPMLSPIFQTLQATELNAFLITGLVIKEALIGLLIGAVFGVPFWAAEVAGQTVDLQRAVTMGQISDPAQMEKAGVTATFLTITLVALFFASGGFNLMLTGLYQSYDVWPPVGFAPLMEQGASLAVLGLLDQVMAIGLRMMAPIIIAILVTDFMMSYLARMSPNLQVFSLSLSVKNLVFSVLMVFYIVFLVPRMLNDLGTFNNVIATMKAISGNGASP